MAIDRLIVRKKIRPMKKINLPYAKKKLNTKMIWSSVINLMNVLYI
jgi:hypothetical protein